MEKRLLGLSLTLALANVVVVTAKDADGHVNTSPSSTPFGNSEAWLLMNYGVADPSNMTYRPTDDPDAASLEHGRKSEGLGSSVEVNVTAPAQRWVWECQSNYSTHWGVTWPVCSTRFTSLVVMVVVMVVLGVITLWTIIGNALVLAALYRYRVLRTMSNCLIGNLAVSDLLLAITVLPISAANDVLGYWVFGSTMCTLWLCIDVLYCTASIWGLCTIALDRYTATVYPMWYHDRRSPQKALAYMVFVWLFSIVISLAPFIGWQDMIPNFYKHDDNINRYVCILFSSQSYVIYSAVGSFILPLCLMTFLYVQIFVVLHRQADHLRNRSRPISGGEISSRLDTDCPTFALQDSRGQRILSRDFTASTFMPDLTPSTADRDQGKREEMVGQQVEEGGARGVGVCGVREGGEDGDDEDKEGSDVFLTSRTRLDVKDRGRTGPTRVTRFDLNGTGQCSLTRFDLKAGQTGQGYSSPSHSPEGADKDSDVTLSPSRTRFHLESTGHSDHGQGSSFDLDDTGQTGEDRVSFRRCPSLEEAEEEGEVEASKNPLLQQRSDSLNTVLDPASPPVTPPVIFPTFHQKDLLRTDTRHGDHSFSNSGSPMRISHMRKSRSTAFCFEDDSSPALKRRSTSFSPPPRIPPGRCHSIGAFCRTNSAQMENGYSGKCSLQRSPSAASNRYSMNISLRRRFQLREQRATKRMLLIMACFFVCWIPFTLMYMLRSLCPYCTVLDDHVAAFIIWLGYVNSSLNPLLYTLFNEDFRKAFKRLLGLYRPRRFSATATPTE